MGTGLVREYGTMLTAGHVMYECNEKVDQADRDVRRLNGTTPNFDSRNYLSQFRSTMMGFSDPRRFFGDEAPEAFGHN